MPSTYTNNLGIQLPATGEQAGTWGGIVNGNMNILDRTTNGSLLLPLSAGASNLTTGEYSTTGINTYGQYKVLQLTTGTSPTSPHTITILPNDAQKIYFVYNTTAVDAVFTQGSGGNVTIAAGDSGIIYANGGGGAATVVNLTDHFAMNSVKITGGTIAGVTGSFSSVTLPAATTETRSIEVGQGRAGNGASLVDLVGDATYTDYGARFIRENTGPDAETSIYHRGTSALRMITQEVAPITFSTTTTERMRVHASGGVSIGNTTDPGATNLSVTGTVDATTLSIGGTAITSTAAELNILDGVTATAAELNILDGVTATTAELNFVDGVTSAIQTQIDNRVTSNADDALTGGYTTTAVNDGTFTNGQTYTLTPAGGNMRRIINGATPGQFTLAAPTVAGDYTMVIQITNGTSPAAGGVALSGFSRTTGNAFTSTPGHDFFVYVTKCNDFTLANVVALQ